MYSVSDLFKQYMAMYDRLFECRATIGTTVYENSQVIDFKIDDSIAAGEELELGSVISSKITISLRTQDVIPVNAKIIPEVRMNGSEGYTEWVPLGTYYIDGRSYDNGIWTLNGYDKLIMSNQTFVSSLVYPIAMTDVLDEICTQLEITLDTSVVIDPAYMIPYQDLEITIHDMLSYIASAHGACFKLTKDEKLAFIKFSAAATPSVTVTPSDYVTCSQTNPVKSYTRLKVTYNTDDEYLEAGIGDDDHTLKFYNQFITQDMLDAIFADINGLTYTPVQMPWRGDIYSEVGDTVSIGKGNLITWSEYQSTWATADIPWNGIEYFNTIVLRSSITFKGGLKTEWSSPSTSPQRSEFGFTGNVNRRIQSLDKSTIKEGKPYYGVTVGRENGLKIEKSDGTTVVIFNSDKLEFKSSDGTVVMISQDGIIQSWGDSIVDNVDPTHTLKLKFYIPPEVISVKSLKLNFSLEPFRAYETGATSSASSLETSASGGASISQYSDWASWSGTSEGGCGGAATTGSHTHNRHFNGHSHTYMDSGVQRTTDQSMVNIDVPTDSAGDHSHTVWLYNHRHYIQHNNLHNHEFTIPGHSHSLVYGIYESTSPYGVKVYVDGTLRLDNGGSGYSTDEADLDITQWVDMPGWHTIELSSFQLGRINAAYFIQVFMGVGNNE